MSTKQAIVDRILSRAPRDPKEAGSAYAPVNIALVKYWGKRSEALNLPVTGSLSVTLPLGTHTTIREAPQDLFVLHGQPVSSAHPFATRLRAFLDLFRDHPARGFHVETRNEVPTGAGLASSASGYAACVLALQDLFGWDLSRRELSILARLGSGSACRSLFSGFVEWHAGSHDDGMDCYAEPLSSRWDALRLGLVVISDQEKAIDSRSAMRHSQQHSLLYASWPQQVAQDLARVKAAIVAHDFSAFGTAVENNALAMHAVMMAASPPVLYFLPETVALIHRVWQARRAGLPLFFTIDAGPNVKLLFLDKDEGTVREQFPEACLLRFE